MINKARELFVFAQGNYSYMQQGDILDEYLSYHIPAETEHIWRTEILQLGIESMSKELNIQKKTLLFSNLLGMADAHVEFAKVLFDYAECCKNSDDLSKLIITEALINYSRANKKLHNQSLDIARELLNSIDIDNVSSSPDYSNNPMMSGAFSDNQMRERVTNNLQYIKLLG